MNINFDSFILINLIFKFFHQMFHHCPDFICFSVQPNFHHPALTASTNILDHIFHFFSNHIYTENYSILLIQLFIILSPTSSCMRMLGKHFSNWLYYCHQYIWCCLSTPFKTLLSNYIGLCSILPNSCVRNLQCQESSFTSTVFSQQMILLPTSYLQTPVSAAI